MNVEEKIRNYKKKISTYEKYICCNECKLWLDDAKYWLHILEEGLYEIECIRTKYGNKALIEKLKKTEYEIFLAEEYLEEIFEKLKNHFNK